MPPTSKLDGGLSTDDGAEGVGSQAAVVAHMLLFNRVADHQAAPHETEVAALGAEVDLHVVLPPPAANNSHDQKTCFSLLYLVSFDWF